MSLIRLALRAATVLALSNYEKEPFPTFAGPFVFDSKMDPIADTVGETLLPCAIVYTDKDEQLKPDTGSGGIVFHERRIALTIECCIGTFSKAGPKWIETDPELEAMLDLFEWQVWFALQGQSAGAIAWRKLVKRVEAWVSVPGRSAEGNTRISVRQINAVLVVNNDCRPQVGVLGPGEAFPAPQTDDLLGVPYLAALEKTLKTKPEFAHLADLLAAARAGQPVTVLPRFAGMSMGFYTMTPNPETGESEPAPGSRVEVNLKP